ncbi:MAG: hypothetical protein ALAOOOJD_01370 [bacterium]|nr:hypothetical protein [bacterium]
MQQIGVTMISKKKSKPEVPADPQGERAYGLDCELSSRLNPHETLVVSGFWRSGTTWLEEALREILEAKTLFEPLDPLADDMQAVLAHDGVATKKFEFLRLYMPYCNAGTLHGHPLYDVFYRALRSESRGAWVRRFRKGLEESYRSRLVVKFVTAQLCLRAAQNTFDMPVLHVYRDPRAVVASIKKTRWHWLFDHLVLRKHLLRERDGRDDFFGQWREEILDYDRQHPIARVAAYWALTEKFLEHSYADYRGRTVFVSYEKLAQQRETIFAALLAQLGLRPAQENFRVLGDDSTTTSDAQRGASVGERLAGWKKFLTAPEIAVIESIVQRFDLEDRLVNATEANNLWRQ